MASTWLNKLQTAQKTCIIQDGRKKVHFTFLDGTEMAEEYEVKTNELVVRKFRKKVEVGMRNPQWEFEVGEQMMPKNLEAEGLMESGANPILVRKDTTQGFQWRIRNLPYPLDVYSTSIDDDKRFIILRTSNKKYYKKFNIPDMERAKLPVQQKEISMAHANNTLIITYKKPKEILEMERQIQAELKKLKASNDGDVDCTPS